MKIEKEHAAYGSPGLKGLTKREYFAIRILAALVNNPREMPDSLVKNRPGEKVGVLTCEEAVRYADGLIEALNKY